MNKVSPGCMLGAALFSITVLGAVFGVTYAGSLGVAWLTGWPTFHSFFALLGCAAFALGSYLLISIQRSVEGMAENVEDIWAFHSDIDAQLDEENVEDEAPSRDGGGKGPEIIQLRPVQKKSGKRRR